MRLLTLGQQCATQMFTIALWILGVLDVCHGRELRLLDYQAAELLEEQSDSSPQDWLERVSSMDEMLMLLHPAYGQVQHCFRQRSDTMPPQLERRDDVGRAPRDAAALRSDGVMKAVLEEMRRTKCQPREVFLEVSKEYPEDTNRFFMPSCVSVHRCGGCCNDESLFCTNTSYTIVEKTLVELLPIQKDKSIVMATFVNHTSCKCQFKRPLHELRKRSALTDWPVPPAKETEPLEGVLQAFCGPKKVLDRKSCECICQNGLTQESCRPGQVLDENSCQCIGMGQLATLPGHAPRIISSDVPVSARHAPPSARLPKKKNTVTHAGQSYRPVE